MIQISWKKHVFLKNQTWSHFSSEEENSPLTKKLYKKKWIYKLILLWQELTFLFYFAQVKLTKNLNAAFCYSFHLKINTHTN